MASEIKYKIMLYLCERGVNGMALRVWYVCIFLYLLQKFVAKVFVCGKYKWGSMKVFIS